MVRPIILYISFLVIWLFANIAFAENKWLGTIGTFEKWSKVEILFEGPVLKSGEETNPFNILIDVSFAGPNGQVYIVPGFFDGDGEGGQNGNVWKVRFAADQIGRWHFESKSDQNKLIEDFLRDHHV